MARFRTTLMVLALVSTASLALVAQAPVPTPVPATAPAQRPATVYGDGLFAEVQTNKGLIVLQLEFEKTPLSVMNFVGLAEGTIENKSLPLGTPFFDGSAWHRVVPGHVIQTGQPKGGQTGLGYTIPNEIDPTLNHGRDGMLGMANSGPHTNTSQFYITLADRSYLDGIYTVFGHVVAGLDVVHAIVQGDTVTSIRIVRNGDKAKAFKADNTGFVALLDAARARVKADEARKAISEEALILKEWPSALTSAGGARYVVTRPGTGDPALSGKTISVSYVGRELNGRPIASSTDAGKPVVGSNAQAFDFEVGKTKITPALDEALAGMRVGEKRTVIAQGRNAYGSGGFFAKDKPGEKRFVIPPGTSLVYEVEVLAIK